jgi:hypothetical protein
MTRILVAVAGVAAAAYGALLLLQEELGEVAGAAGWLASGVVLHDLVLAPAVTALVVLASRLLPPAWRGPAAAALVVLGSVTLLAVPVLGRFGAREDNPTLLDRPYVAGWAVLAGLTVLATLVAGAVRARRSHAGSGPADPGDVDPG